MRKEVLVSPDFALRFEIWDTAGQEHIRYLRARRRGPRRAGGSGAIAHGGLRAGETGGKRSSAPKGRLNTAAQEHRLSGSCLRFRSLAPMYYRGAQAAVIVYDCTNKARRPRAHLRRGADRALLTEAARSGLRGGRGGATQDSFSAAKGWVKELEKQLAPGVVMALCGNKSDLSNLREVAAKVGLGFVHLARGDGGSPTSLTYSVAAAAAARRAAMGAGCASVCQGAGHVVLRDICKEGHHGERGVSHHWYAAWADPRNPAARVHGSDGTASTDMLGLR